MVAKYLLGSEHERDYKTEWWQHLHDESRGIRYTELRAQEQPLALEDRVSRALGLCSAARSTELQSFPSRPYYRDIRKRERLKRVLICLAIWNPRWGFNPNLSHIAALVLEATGSERAAFHLLVGLYKRLQLHKYHSQDQTALKRDVRIVLSTVEKLWPGVVAAFLKRQSQQVLVALIEDWLVSLLGKVWTAEERPLAEILPYLDRLVMSANGGRDPRKFLRNMVACTFQLHVQELVRVDSPWPFCKNHARVGTRTDRALLELMDATLAPDTCAWLNGTALLPIGLAAGYIGGLQILPLLSGLQATSGIAAWLSMGALPVVSSLAGAVALFQIGCSAGVRLVQQVASDIQKAADAIGTVREKEDAIGAAREKEDAIGAVREKEEPNELDLDTFFFRHVRDVIERTGTSMYSQFRAHAEASSAWATFTRMLPA